MLTVLPLNGPEEMDSAGVVLHNLSMATDELTFLHCAHYSRCRATVDKRFTYHTLQFITRGGVALSYDDERYDLDGPWCFPAMPGPWVKFCSRRANSSWEHRYVAFQGARVEGWSEQGWLLDRPQRVEAGEVKVLTETFDRLIEQARRTSRYGRLRAGNLLEEVLLRLAERRSSVAAADRPAWLERTLDALRDLDVEPDYAALAEASAMSASTLRRRFKQATGLSPHAYRLQHRAGAARRLLGDTDEPIKVIAERLGYRDVYYFTRQFKQATGVTPGAYRRSGLR